MQRLALLCTYFLLLALLLPAASVFAKGAPETITMRGPGLAKPIEITEPKSLQDFNPWSGQFLGTMLAEPPAVDRSYQVSFYMQAQVIYVLYYAPDPAGGQGYIYLPGKEDEWYHVNRGTIIRTDGHWHQAADAWDELMRRVIPSAQEAATSGRSISPRDRLRSSLWFIIRVFIERH